MQRRSILSSLAIMALVCLCFATAAFAQFGAPPGPPGTAPGGPPTPPPTQPAPPKASPPPFYVIESIPVNNRLVLLDAEDPTNPFANPDALPPGISIVMYSPGGARALLVRAENPGLMMQMKTLVTSIDRAPAQVGITAMCLVLDSSDTIKLGKAMNERTATPAGTNALQTAVEELIKAQNAVVASAPFLTLPEEEEVLMQFSSALLTVPELKLTAVANDFTNITLKLETDEAFPGVLSKGIRVKSGQMAILASGIPLADAEENAGKEAVIVITATNLSAPEPPPVRPTGPPTGPPPGPPSAPPTGPPSGQPTKW